MLHADYAYVYPDRASVHRVRVAREAVPNGARVVGSDVDEVDGEIVDVLVYVAPEGSVLPETLTRPLAPVTPMPSKRWWQSRGAS